MILNSNLHPCLFALEGSGLIGTETVPDPDYFPISLQKTKLTQLLAHLGPPYVSHLPFPGEILLLVIPHSIQGTKTTIIRLPQT